MSNDTQLDITEMVVVSTDTTTFHTDGEPTVHTKHFFDIDELEKVGLKFHKTMFLCGARCYFNEP